MVRFPKNSGGIGIKDIHLMNLALGAKIVWRLLTGLRDWWKHAMGMKYFGKLNIEIVEQLKWEGQGSSFWKPCTTVAYIITGNKRW